MKHRFIFMAFCICSITGKYINTEELASQARADIAKAIEKNLIRIFAIATAQNERTPIPRQDEDIIDIDDVVTPNPNVLPQVAQILGAVFSGSLNITRIVDGTVGLVPNLVRNQLQGLVKLLTGENVNLSGSTTTSSSKDAPSTVVPLVKPSAVTTSPSKLIVSTEEGAITGTTTVKGKYKIRSKTKKPATATSASPNLVDDEIERIERELITIGKLLAPYEHREPRVYAGMFSNILQNMNMTEVTKVVPNIFKGATQAFVLLENLGMLEALPGSEVIAQDLDEEEE